VRCSRAHDFPQRVEQAVHFFDRVVVHQADAEKAAGFFHVEMLGEVEGIVISVPGEDAALAKFGGEFERSVAGFPGNDSYGDCAAAVIKARRIGDAVDFYSADFPQACHGAIEQRAFVMVDRGVGGFDGAPSVACFACAGFGCLRSRFWRNC